MLASANKLRITQFLCPTLSEQTAGLHVRVDLSAVTVLRAYGANCQDGRLKWMNNE